MITLIISMLPLIELRGAIPYAILSGMSPTLAIMLSVIANSIVIILGYAFLDYAHEKLLAFPKYKSFFENYLDKKLKRLKGKKLSFFLLFLFVAIPLPGTGAYTGTLLAWFFKLDRVKSFWTMFLALITVAILITLIILGGLTL